MRETRQKLGEYDLLVIGVSHRETPIERLEKVSFDETRHELGLRDLCTRPHVASGMILSTCNRVEVYAIGSQPGLQESCEAFFQHWCVGNDATIDTHRYLKTGREALAHLFNVAASVDSLVPGEAQILGQVKEAYEKLCTLKRSHPVMDRLVRKTISVAKRVRTDTGIAAQAVSIASCAVDLARRIFSDLRQKKVLLIGAGEMGELTAQHLVGRGIAEVIVCNRSYENALELVKKFSATSIPFESMYEYMKSVDIVVVSTGARDHVIEAKRLQRIMSERMNRQLFIIDIAMPRNVDPKVNDLDNVYLYNIEDLKAVVHENLEGRRREMARAAEIVAFEIDNCLDVFEKRRYDALIAEVRAFFEATVRAEIRRAHANASDADDEKLVQALTDKLMQQPLRSLQEEGAEEAAAALRRFIAAPADGDEHGTSANRQPRQ